MEASTEKVLESNRNAFVPAVMAIGVASIVCSYSISNYWGMTLAIIALMTTQFGLRNVSRTIWFWCIGLATTGFALGLAALLMRIFIDTVRH